MQVDCKELEATSKEQKLNRKMSEKAGNRISIIKWKY